MKSLVIKQKMWRRWRYVTKNETVYSDTDHKSLYGPDLSDLESHKKKRKAGECLDEGSDDAAVSGHRPNVYFACVLFL